MAVIVAAVVLVGCTSDEYKDSIQYKYDRYFYCVEEYDGMPSYARPSPDDTHALCSKLNLDGAHWSPDWAPLDNQTDTAPPTDAMLAVDRPPVPLAQDEWLAWAEAEITALWDAHDDHTTRLELTYLWAQGLEQRFVQLARLVGQMGATINDIIDVVEQGHVH